MSENYFKIYKVFDIHNDKKPLPYKYHEALGIFLHENIGNDAWHDWPALDEDPNIYSPRHDPQTIVAVNQWLRDSGAETGDIILIRYWW